MVKRNPFNKAAGKIFIPKGVKEGGFRVDPRGDIPFDAQIEWHGVRLGWSRMTICPCKGINNVTDQVDPDCPSCTGSGWTPVATEGYFVDKTKVGPLNTIQQLVVDKNKCMVIRGIPMGVSSQPNMFAALGDWALGTVMFTVRSENRLSYYDRLIHLDDVAPFSERIVSAPAGTPIKLRYPADEINGLISLTQRFGNADVVLDDNGNVVFLPGRAPPAGTQLSITYMHHPVFTVIEFPHLIRTVPVRNKKPPALADTPTGDYMRLPQQVIARLEHLPQGFER